MTLEEGLVSFLISQTGVTSLVAQENRVRIFPLFIPQRTRLVDQMPCVVYQINGEERQKVYCGTESLVMATVQLDCYALTLQLARSVSNAIRSVLKDYRGLMGDVVVRDVTLTGGLALPDMEPGLMRVVDTYTIWFEEE